MCLPGSFGPWDASSSPYLLLLLRLHVDSVGCHNEWELLGGTWWSGTRPRVTVHGTQNKDGFNKGGAAAAPWTPD